MFEIFLDECSFHLWTVRPKDQRSYNNIYQLWFSKKDKAEFYFKWLNTLGYSI